MKRQVLLFFYFIVASLIFSCSKSHAPSIPITFSSDKVTINAGKEYTPISITLGKALPPGAEIKISISAGANITIGDGKMIEVSPAPVDNVITLGGTNDVLTFYVTSNLSSALTEDGSVTFEISQVPSGYAKGLIKSMTIAISNNTLSSGLVGEYLFNSGAFDTSEKGHDGTVHGATLETSRTGKPSACYSFDGLSNYISVPSNTDNNFTSANNFSISLWAAPDATQLESNINDILRKWAGDAQGYPYSISYLNSTHPSNPNQLLVVRYDGSTCSDVPMAYTSAVNSNFHHLVMVKNGSTVYVYLDGALSTQIIDNTTTGSSCGTSNTTDMTIGCRGQLVRYFKGMIDDIRIYNRALNASEVNLLYGL